MSEKILNKEQLQAIKHKNGPLLIIAGAGTGKTTVIVERIKHLISSSLASPEEILALTFTEKAAAEMEERIDQAMPYGYTQMWITTFHSFCDRILRDEAFHIGLSPNYKLATNVDRVALVKKHLFEFPLDYYRPLGNPHRFISALLSHFDRLRDENIFPEDYEKFAKSLPDNPDNQPEEDCLTAKQYTELAQSYTLFQKLKLEGNLLDFSDLISYTLSLFEKRPNILQKYQRRFKFVLVDEYQDTNFTQNLLVNQLVGKPANLTVVADDDQSIYRWRGAAISNVLQFQKTYPKSKLVVLTRNYRSTQEILDSSYRLIQNNNPDRLEVRAKIDKKLKSYKHLHDSQPELIYCEQLADEADAVAKKIQSILTEKSPTIEPRDIAILVRANNHALPFIKSLAHLGIPFQFLGPNRLLDQPEIKELVSYLRLLRDPYDDQSFYRAIMTKIFNVSPSEILWLTNFSRRQNISLYSSCHKISLSGFPFPPEISPSFPEKISVFLKMFQTHLEQINKFTAGELLFSFLNDSGILKSIINYQSADDEIRAQNISRFFSKLKSFESSNTDASVPAILDWLDLSVETGESPSAGEIDWSLNNSVNIMTIHASKGLEFPVVFLVNLVSQRFPSTEKGESLPIPDILIKEILPQGDYHLQEERRLCYVGLTRAKSRLFLTAAKYYGDGKRPKKISPFVPETLGEKFLTPKVTAGEAVQPSLLDWQPSGSLSPSSVALNPIKVDYLSYSQIQTFKDCPLHYKAKYILRIPSPPSAASSFGNTIHRTMKDYFELIRNGEHPDILKIFSRNWTPEGYLNSFHAQAYFDKGQQYLRDFVVKNNTAIYPAKLEDSFIVSLGPIKIGGKIDRVDILPDKSLEIIDYKTGMHPLDIKKAATDLQLSFYALAATLIPHPPYGLPSGKIILSLYYFEDQSKISVTQTARQLQSAREEILDFAKQIEKSDFKCNHSRICQSHCDYRSLCDLESG
jgi:DNA helicase-2/ATP-dependent DNA helicase PcrA